MWNRIRQRRHNQYKDGPQPAIERGLREGNEVEGARHQSAYDAHSGPQKEQVHEIPYLLSSRVSAAIYL